MWTTNYYNAADVSGGSVQYAQAILGQIYQ